VIGLNRRFYAVVENDLRSGLLGCPELGYEAALGPWGSARERLVRGAGRLLPRRADAVTVIGIALLAKANGAGHRPIAVLVKVPPSTVRSWLRRIVAVADWVPPIDVTRQARVPGRP
jgi:hypothetical protein